MSDKVKKYLFALIMFIAAACSSPQAELKESAEQKASDAAESFYRNLYNGDYEAFLNGKVNAENMPESYRKALITSYKQHVATVKEQHRGVKDVEATRAKMDTTLQLMQVFLLLQYGDSLQEEIVVPMVEQEGEWKLK